MPSERDKPAGTLRDRLIGLGERSMAKSYYPELRSRLEELERFRAVVDHANDAIFLFRTEDWTVTDVNETALMMLDLTRPEVLGGHISRFFPPEIAARYVGALKDAQSLQFRNGHIVTTLFGAQGRTLPAEITVTLRTVSGVGYAVLIARDVSIRQIMEAELDKSRQIFASFMENSPAMASIKDPEGRYLFCNPAFAEWLGASAQNIVGHTDAELWDADSLLIIQESDAYVLHEGEPIMLHECLRAADSSKERHVHVTKFPLLQNRVMIGVGVIGVDVTRQMQAEKALQESEDRHRIVAEYTHGMECWISPSGRALYVSPSCERITGRPRDYFLENPKGLEEIVHEDDLRGWRQFHAQGMDDESLDYRIRRENGEVRWVNEVKREVMGGNGGSMGTRISLRDITERKHMELQLRHLALHDPLTGLANRSLCLDRIQQAMDRSRRRRHLFSVVFLDLDRFKVLNDSLGHAFGDQVLVAVADVLRACVRALDTVSRFGGDEFVLLLEEMASPREAIQTVQRIRQALRRPLVIQGHEVQLTASLGITLGLQGAESPADLLRNANVAMHQAKKAGRNRFKAFTLAMLERASRLLVLETDLRRAIGRGEFFLAYQPIVRLDGQATLHGFEALVRWNHPRKGLISPGEFIPVAEESGLIVDIGLIVLREACRTLEQWRRELPAAQGLVMSVNLSPRQFSDPQLVEAVKGVLAETGLPAGALKLEITESAIMDNAASAVEKLRRLKNLGMALSIDDFGTGYSSMSSLQQFPLDTLKIDLSFIRRMEDGPEGLEIVKAIVSLAHSLQLQVIAEGVEQESQERTLRGLTCEFAQGYRYAKPLPSEQARAYLIAQPKG